MKPLVIVTGFLLSASLASAQSVPAHASHSSAHHSFSLPADLAWSPGPASLPAGSRVAVLEGDPSKPGPFTIRLSMPDGYKIAPHSHPGIEHVTVLDGIFLMGMGDQFNAAKGTALPAGAFAVMQPGTRHYAWTQGQTTIQLHGMGPWQIVYANPADDPRKRASN